MIITTTGQICENFYLLGHPGYPMYLFNAPQPTVFDACVSFAGNIYVEEIRTVLGDREPSILFLTHVHWDHCGATSHLKDVFPSMKVAASELAAGILERPNAVALMKRLNDEARIEILSCPGVDKTRIIDKPFRPFQVDIELKDGSTFDLGNGTIVEILATPGHTRDHHSFYMPRERILIAGEAAGLLLQSGDVATEFLSSYDDYLSSLERLAALPVDIFCQGHGLVLVGREEINDFFRRSIEETISFKERVFELLDQENGSLERVMQCIKAERYDNIPGMKQSEIPYMINLKAKVKHLAAKKAAM